MGRGRQKAKHTKIARDLKYFSPDTDYAALERELGHEEPGSIYGSGQKPPAGDPWADYEDEDAEYDEELDED